MGKQFWHGRSSVGDVDLCMGELAKVPATTNGVPDTPQTDLWGIIPGPHVPVSGVLDQVPQKSERSNN